MVTVHRVEPPADPDRVRTTPDLLQELVQELAGEPILPDDAEALLLRHRGSIREALRDLEQWWDRQGEPPSRSRRPAGAGVKRERAACIARARARRIPRLPMKLLPLCLLAALPPLAALAQSTPAPGAHGRMEENPGDARTSGPKAPAWPT